MRVAVVTDSTSDLPPHLVAENQIFIIPAILVIDGKSLEDGPEISRDSFYRALPSLKTPPTTASPSIDVYMALYSRLRLAGYDRVVSIHVSRALSGVHDTAMSAAQNFDGFVHVVDSGQVSMGLGFQVLAAAHAARQGNGLEDVIAAAIEIRSRIRVVAMLDTMEYVRRSGRVTWAQASIGQVLQLKPFLSIRDGSVVRMGDARTRRGGIERLYKFISDLGPLEQLAILHSNPETDALFMAENFSPHTLQNPLIVQVTSIIGTHVGPNGLGFAAVVQ